MRAVLQRVLSADVTVDKNIVGKIDKGIVVLLGMHSNDDDKVIEYILDKIVNMRIFEDENEKMNLSLIDIKGELLIIPNFTLYGDARKGRRPGYSEGASPDEARKIFEKVIEKSKNLSLKKIEFGIFQADMLVNILNDGPVTLLLDSDRKF